MTEQFNGEVEQTETPLTETTELSTQQDSSSIAESEEETEAKKNKFKVGDKLTFVRVRFPGNAKSFPFMIGSRPFQYGQKVIAPSDRGMALGYINSFPYEVDYDDSMLPLKYINKIASDEDIEADRNTYDKQKEAEVLAIELIEKFQLDMNLTHVEFTQFGKKTVFYFTAPNRVDFRSLVKELVTKLKTRIELRQISVRDRAASIGGIGSCGRQLCCSSFLQKYGSATIKMAKNQNMMLAGNKINGVCGQLKCCIQYEDEVYSYKRKNLPKEGKFIQVKNGDRGKVLKLEILAENFTMLTDRGVKKRFAADQFNKKDAYLGDDYHFPHRFDHISDETSQLITDIREGEKPHDSSILEVFKQQSGIVTGDSSEEKEQNTPQKSANREDKQDKKDRPRRHRSSRSNKNRSHHSKSAKGGNSSNRPQGEKKPSGGQGNSSNSGDRGNSKKKKDFVYKRR